MSVESDAPARSRGGRRVRVGLIAGGALWAVLLVVTGVFAGYRIGRDATPETSGTAPPPAPATAPDGRRAGREVPVTERDLGPFPHFELTASDGRTVTCASLAGSVWVADFVFTACPSICPDLVGQFAALDAAFADMPGVRFVSITVDPENDTPEVLADYGADFGAVAGRWDFLTAGTEAATRELIEDRLKLSKSANLLDHSTRFILVDRDGIIRGYYDGLRADNDLPRLIADMRLLLNVPSE